MWCRALLTATLLAYLLCVLILSGLQKEDLDVALLRKLMRHNVNVDDLENPSLRKDCLSFENKTNGRRKENEENETLVKLIAVNNTLDVTEQIIKADSAKDDSASMTNLLKLIKSMKAEEKKQENNESKPTQSSNIVQLLLTPAPPISINFDTNSTDYLSKLIKKLMAPSTTTKTPTIPQITTKTTPTTKRNQFDLANLVKDIKYMIASRDKNETISFSKLTRKRSGVRYNGNVKNAANKEYKENISNTANINIFKPSRSTTKAGPKQMSLDVIPSNIIKDIAESVKALVLQDLKKEISTMQSLVSNTTSLPTTDRDSALIKDATIAFAEFVQLFQQLKTTLTPIIDRNISAQMKQHTMRGLRNPLTASLTTLATGTLLNNGLHNLNAELNSIPVYKSINRIEQVNIFNHRNDLNPPITIQSNVNQIPPLTIPVIDSPVKMVYQNIIVTSESPFDYFKNIHKNQVYVGSSRSLYNDNKKYTTKIKTPTRSDIEIIREYNAPHSTYHSIKSEDYGHPRHQFGRDYYFERFRTPSYADNYVEYSHRTSHPNHVLRSRSRDNIERFHEKLERTNNWSQLSSERNNKFPIGSRHLLPLNDRKRPKYDDTHFKNFLKTQQKVNDMLERILATKTVAQGRRSVETP